MDLIGRLGPILACIVALTVVEAIIPLRCQPRGFNRRLATNLALTATTLAIGIPLNVALALVAAWGSTNQFGLLPWLGLNGVASAVIAVVLLDFATFGGHVFFHKVRWAWRFHRVHHGDTAVDATTALRQHPVEGLMRFAFTASAVAIAGATVEAVAIYRLLSAVNAVFEHANIRVPRWLDRSLVWLWVTPDMHKVHHSRRQCETDSNYANLFSVFDRSFGTFTSSQSAGVINYGLEDGDVSHEQTFTRTLAAPFRRRDGFPLPRE
jgi:sterol desaturase/sphingolipid hydroxylase (fatty acid hydroxylase superfamily)